MHKNIPPFLIIIWILALNTYIFTNNSQEDTEAKEREFVAHYEKNHNYPQAIAHQTTLVTLRPEDDQELFKLACLQCTYGDLHKALAIYQDLINRYPNFVTALYNGAFTAKNLDQFDIAMPLYQRTLTLEPHNSFAHFGLAQCHLTMGNFLAAWPDFEWRNPEIATTFAHYDFQSMSLTGKRVLIRGEWGLGDNIQFIRYAQLLKKKGATVIMQAYPQLIPLFSHCNFIDEFVDTSMPTFTGFDLQVALLSLPYAFGTTLETIPATIPYLTADPELITYWHKRIHYDTALTIGINWRGCGDNNAPLPLNKNIPLTMLTHTLANIPGIRIYSLQKFSGDNDIQALGEQKKLLHTFEKLDEAHGAFMDTAAIIKNLDIVISVDTSIAHLAGALGTPTWLLLPYKADWRWLLNRTDSPWYPTMRLFRQKKQGDWQETLEEIEHELCTLLITKNES